MHIGRWFYESLCAFNATNLPSFRQMMHDIGKYGVFYDPTSPYELREIITAKRVSGNKKACRDIQEKLST